MAYHGLSQSLLDQGDTALVDGFAVGQEAALQRRGNRRQTLEQREEIFVFILQLVPLGYQRRHQLLYVLLKTQVCDFGDSFVPLLHTKQDCVNVCTLCSQAGSDGVPQSPPMFL